MPAYVPTLKHVKDPSRLIEHHERKDELLRSGSNVTDLLKRFEFSAKAQRPQDENGDMNRKLMGELEASNLWPVVQKGILDSTGGYTSGGSIFIRQDLEPIIHALFVQMFPFFDMCPKGESNGLAHVANQLTATDTNALGATAIAETGTVSYVQGTYARQSYPIAVLGTGRGVTFKEAAAVKAGGAVVQPLQTEIKNGLTALARDVQYFMMQGNATNSSITTATAEGGAYNSLGFDGLRGVVGSVGSFSGNNAIQLDIATLNVTETIKATAARIADNGGYPTVALMSKKAKDACDTENNNNKRYNEDTTEAVAGFRVNKIACVDTDVQLVGIPGTTIGAYNRTSDGAYVEDIYVLDMNHIFLRWLYSETFTVLEIPSGVDGVLSSRYIIFGMYGFEQAAPVFTAKARRVAA